MTLFFNIIFIYLKEKEIRWAEMQKYRENVNNI